MSSPTAPHAHERLRAAYERRTTLTHSWFAPAHAFIIHERMRAMVAVLRTEGLDRLADLRILDLGCGHGYWIRELIQLGADPQRIVGLDLLPARLAAANRLTARGVQWVLASGGALPFRSSTFDLVLQSTVFSSVLEPSMRHEIAREIGRVLEPSGALLWYDFTYNNPRNPDVVGITRAEVRRLFPRWNASLRRVTLAPPIARRIPPALLPLLYPLLSGTRFLRTHLHGVLRPPAP